MPQMRATDALAPLTSISNACSVHSPMDATASPATVLLLSSQDLTVCGTYMHGGKARVMPRERVATDDDPRCSTPDSSTKMFKMFQTG